MEQACREILQFRQSSFDHYTVTGPQVRAHSSDAHDDALKGLRRQIRWIDTIGNFRYTMVFPEAPYGFKRGGEVSAQEFTQ